MRVEPKSVGSPREGIGEWRESPQAGRRNSEGESASSKLKVHKKMRCQISSPPLSQVVNLLHHPVNGSSMLLSPARCVENLLNHLIGRLVLHIRHVEAETEYTAQVQIVIKHFYFSNIQQFLLRRQMHHMQDIKVVVLANLKPRNMRGIKSNGMLMAASDAPHETVELLLPPVDSVPGERIWFGSEEDKDKQPAAAAPNQVQKKKIWEFLQPHLKTSDEGVAVLGHHPMRTSAGVITCRSLKNASIS
ncbi:hypothetical protein KSP40_PGU017395 [Platanthera guangdongensis]|uniref:tRNA-binding domain-containing protein n=1 Tax=Platanthera guangdongensis TaxID=2320717 RepID=A0ABR2MTQ4_9ASPA